MVVLARRVFRIGVQTLEQVDGRFFMSIQNKSYSSRVEVPGERAHLWYAALTKE